MLIGMCIKLYDNCVPIGSTFRIFVSGTSYT